MLRTQDLHRKSKCVRVSLYKLLKLHTKRKKVYFRDDTPRRISPGAFSEAVIHRLDPACNRDCICDCHSRVFLHAEEVFRAECNSRLCVGEVCRVPVPPVTRANTECEKSQSAHGDISALITCIRWGHTSKFTTVVTNGLW